MGARGALKLPNHLRPVSDFEMAGTAAETVSRDAPLKPDAVTSNPELSRLWDEIVPQLERTGLIAPSDGPAVELALRHFLMARQASDSIGSQVSIETSEDHGSVKKNPAEAVFRLESDMFLRYADKLGMTFVSRARTPAAKGRDDGEANPFASTGV